MIKNKNAFFLGVGMSLIFFVVLYTMFSNLDIFGKTNAFHASDNLFNSISKGSTNYFPMLEDKNKTYMEKQISIDLYMPKKFLAPAFFLLQTKGIHVQQKNDSLHIEENLGVIIEQILKDAKTMFLNNEEPLLNAYNMKGKEALFVWWKILQSLDSALKDQKEFQAAKFITEVQKRGVEVAYNFYEIESQKAVDRFGILTFSLVFYVIYTVWWGFAIFFLFEGIGLVTAGKQE